ncbi:hypothetical protein PHMEG_0004811 [Phytophthora megakarya]|uniref:Reverse transcriptase n=1 Tax=Phytophthora megakarya TaxID=4795 RepID=A0A225WUM0_9STRA|nr:hypothetical protein PHMEG_0004811 [Phytophthora megakarya]
MLELTYISVMQEIEAEIASGNMGDDDNLYEHIPNEYERRGPNVTNGSLSGDEQPKLVEVLKRNEGIMIASGNTLPPRGIFLLNNKRGERHSECWRKLYELLKGLLRAGLVTFSDSPWASPIVIVLKKNEVGIRLASTINE